MSGNGASLEQKQEWMRERHAPASAPEVSALPFVQRHFSVAEVATTWNLSQDVVRRLFQDEPGVLVIGDRTPTRSKRSYTTLRIPEAVVQRVYRRLLNP